MKNEDVVYSLTVEDLQTVAKASFGKELSNEQIEIISQKIGDYFGDWLEKIEAAISGSLNLEKLAESNWDEYPY